MQHQFQWSLPPDQWPLSDDEVHVWVADLANNQRFDELLGFLSQDELSKADRFRFSRDRHDYVIGRGLLREILGSYIETRPAILQFHYRENGKPWLANRSMKQNLNFNLSHSGGLLIIAVARNRELGIDLELVRPFSEMEAVASRCFSREEQVTLQYLKFPHKEKNFFRYWTRKEAGLKCSGTGISDQPDFNATRLNYVLREMEPAQGYLASLAVCGNPFVLKSWQWPRAGRQDQLETKFLRTENQPG